MEGVAIVTYRESVLLTVNVKALTPSELDDLHRACGALCRLEGATVEREDPYSGLYAMWMFRCPDADAAKRVADSLTNQLLPDPLSVRFKNHVGLRTADPLIITRT